MEKIRIRELAAKYRLEPTVRDVFVEGEFDRSLVSWFLHQSGLKDVKVRAIDSVDVASELLVRFSLTTGNRQEVIALARELESVLGNIAQVTCIVDCDLDRFLGFLPEGAMILHTDFTSMDMYLFEENSLAKFINVVLGLQEVDVASIRAMYADVLRELFLLRSALRALQLYPGWIDFQRCCELSNGRVTIDMVEVLTRVLNKGGLSSHREAVEDKINELRQQTPIDCRDTIHGHDFIHLLHWHHADRARKKGLTTETAVQRALAACAEIAALRPYPLFAACYARAAG